MSILRPILESCARRLVGSSPALEQTRLKSAPSSKRNFWASRRSRSVPVRQSSRARVTTAVQRCRSAMHSSVTSDCEIRTWFSVSMCASPSPPHFQLASQMGEHSYGHGSSRTLRILQPSQLTMYAWVKEAPKRLLLRQTGRTKACNCFVRAHVFHTGARRPERTARSSYQKGAQLTGCAEKISRSFEARVASVNGFCRSTAPAVSVPRCTIA